MNATAIVAIGVGIAAFLYIRSQQAQAAALAAAAATPQPGLVDKIENTAKKYGGLAWSAASNVPGAALRTAGSVMSPVASGAASVAHAIGGLF